jgi:hypothetical protein
MSASTPARKPLGVRVTPEQHRLLTEAAAREHRSVSSFVLRAALYAAKAGTPKPRKSPEEIKAILTAFRTEVQAANVDNRDILADFLAERRAEAARD